MLEQLDTASLVLFWFSIADVIVGLISVITNGIVIVAIIRSKIWQKCRFFLFLLSMAVGSIVYALTLVLTKGVLRAIETAGAGTIRIYMYGVLTQTQAAAIGLPVYVGTAYYQWIMMLISMERFYAYASPMHYKAHGEKFERNGAILAAVLVAVFIGCGFIGTQNSTPVPATTASYSFTPAFFQFFLFGGMIIPGISAVLLYAGVWLMSLKQKDDDVKDYNSPQRQRHRALTRLVTSHVILYTFTSGIGLSLIVTTGLVRGLNPVAQALIASIGGIFITANHILDLVVYMLRSKDVRDAITQTLGMRTNRIGSLSCTLLN